MTQDVTQDVTQDLLFFIHPVPQTTQDKLDDDLKLAQFMKDADQIDAAAASHEAFLDFDDLGNSLDDVENLMKNHEGENIISR